MPQTLSCFHDETGEQDMRAGYYMVVMVVHDQADVIDGHVGAYRERLRAAGLPDTPFHMVDLVHGHGDYEGMRLADRKRLLVSFATFVRSLPISYRLFSYTAFDVKDAAQLADRLERDVESFVSENLELFQGYDDVAVYYDGGHQAVGAALRRAFAASLASDVTHHKSPRYQDKRLSQVADFLCSIELAAMRYAEGPVSATYEKFFGGWKDFRANYLKQARRKRLG